MAGRSSTYDYWIRHARFNFDPLSFGGFAIQDYGKKLDDKMEILLCLPLSLTGIVGSSLPETYAIEGYDGLALLLNGGWGYVVGTLGT